MPEIQHFIVIDKKIINGEKIIFCMLLYLFNINLLLIKYIIFLYMCFYIKNSHFLG